MVMSMFRFSQFFFDSKGLLLYSISHKQTNNKLRSCARHELREILMKQLVSENFAKRSVICNVLLVLLLCVPIIMGLYSITIIPIIVFRPL